MTTGTLEMTEFLPPVGQMSKWRHRQERTVSCPSPLLGWCQS